MYCRKVLYFSWIGLIVQFTLLSDFNRAESLYMKSFTAITIDSVNENCTIHSREQDH